MASFLGSGSTLLDRNYAPVYDRFESASDDEDNYYGEEEFESEQPTLVTLAEVGYSFTPFGGLILHSKKEKVNAVFKIAKLPHGTTLPKLADDECSICLTPVDPPSSMSVTLCGHRYCRECLAYYLHLESGDLKNLHHTISHLETTAAGSHHLRIRTAFGVRCPHPTCHKIIESEEFATLVEQETWERYNDLTLLITVATLSKEGDIPSCNVPRCGGMLQNCVCTNPLCRRRAALIAEKKRSHLYRQWLSNERNGMELLRKWSIGVAARQCPKCGFLIEKNGGCDHMYCVSCQTRYNWSASSNREWESKA